MLQHCPISEQPGYIIITAFYKNARGYSVFKLNKKFLRRKFP